MTGTNRRILLGATAALLVLLAGCTKKEEAPAPAPVVEKPAPPPAAEPMPAGPVATAQVAGAAGSTVMGTVTFRDTGNGIAIEAHVSGLAPGMHGFHIHEVGDCSGDFSKAGAHFNPDAKLHAGPDAVECHNGDLGNLLAGPDGNAMITMNSRRFTLDQGPSGVVGRSVVIHATEDDLKTQPTGNSGARIACGVITLQAGAPAGATPAGDSGAGAIH